MSTTRTVPKRSPPNFTDPGSFVTFNIGPIDTITGKATTFLCHKEFAIYASPVLEAAFQSAFIEGQTQTYSLEDTTPPAFRYFMQWVYQGDIKKEFGVVAESDADYDYTIVPKELLALVEAWVLGDKLWMPTFQDRIMQMLCDSYNNGDLYGLLGTVEYMYEGTSQDSPLRLFFITAIGSMLVCGAFEPREIMEAEILIPKQALLDLLMFRCSEVQVSCARSKVLHSEDFRVDEEQVEDVNGMNTVD